MRGAAIFAAVMLLMIPIAHSMGTSGDSLVVEASVSFDEGVTELINAMDFSAWQAQLTGAGTGIDARSLVERFAAGNFSVEPGEILSALLLTLLEDIAGIVPQMTVILSVSVLCGVLLKLREATPGEAASAAEYACYLMAAVPLVIGFSGMMQRGREAVDGMVEFSRAFYPTMLALLAALGGTASGTVFQPAVITASHVLSVAVRDVLLWVLLLCAALSVLNHLSPRLKLSGLSSLLMSLASWCMGIAFTVFLGVLTVQGVAASAFDGVALRTAKYAIDNFVPVVGGMFADTVDTLVGCSLIVQNAVGLAGLLTIAALALRPCLAILASMLAYKLCAAVLEPVADGRIVGAMKDFCKILTLLFVAVLSVGAMFFVMTTAVISSGNAILAAR